MWPCDRVRFVFFGKEGWTPMTPRRELILIRSLIVLVNVSLDVWSADGLRRFGLRCAGELWESFKT